MQANVDVVKQFCKYFELKDKESYLKLCDDNIEWIATRHIPEGAGGCAGKKAMFDEYLPNFFAKFKKFHSIQDEFLDAGENIIVLGKYEIISHSGENFKAHFAQIYTIKNGKIVRFRQYADSATIQRALPPSLDI